MLKIHLRKKECDKKYKCNKCGSLLKKHECKKIII